jgi:hypothetical protein
MAEAAMVEAESEQRMKGNGISYQYSLAKRILATVCVTHPEFFEGSCAWIFPMELQYTLKHGAQCCEKVV